MLVLASSSHGYSHLSIKTVAEATLDELKALCLGQRAGLSADPMC